MTVLGIPSLVAATQGVELSPTGMLILGILNLAAGLTLSELEPSLRRERVSPDRLTPAQTRQVAEELDRRMRDTPA
jgi:hypothetical protein